MHSSSPRSLAFCVAILGALTASSRAGTTYFRVDLGPGRLIDINNQNQIIGYDASGAFVIQQDGSRQYLGELGSNMIGINDSGKILLANGSVYDTATGSSTAALGFTATAIDNRGDIIGYAPATTDATGTRIAAVPYMYEASTGQIVNLRDRYAWTFPTYSPANTFDILPTGINENGQIIGVVTSGYEKNQMVDRFEITGGRAVSAGGPYNWFGDINDKGNVVMTSGAVSGWSELFGNRAFAIVNGEFVDGLPYSLDRYWDYSSGKAVLWGYSSEGLFINNLDQIIAYGAMTDLNSPTYKTDPLGFGLLEKGEYRNLTDLVDPFQAEGWIPGGVAGINDLGFIIGGDVEYTRLFPEGLRPWLTSAQSGDGNAWLLIPLDLEIPPLVVPEVPEPASLAILLSGAPALLGIARRRRRSARSRSAP